jgi:hypothetical protein
MLCMTCYLHVFTYFDFDAYNTNFTYPLTMHKLIVFRMILMELYT